MRKLYNLLFMLAISLGGYAQYQVNGSTQFTPEAGYPNSFFITQLSANQAGSVFNTVPINLNQNFVITAQMNFGANLADGMAFVLQGEGAGYLGNSGAGIGYHRFDNENPIPSFIAEFDTYSNNANTGYPNCGDPLADHIGFMSKSNAFHNNPATALAPPISFPVNFADAQWHDVKFSWDVASNTFSVQFLNNTYTYQGNIATICGGGSSIYWGFTGSTGHAFSEQRVRILNIVTGQPIVISGNVTNASCTGGAIGITVTGGAPPYTYSWSNGSTSQNLTNVPAGTYTVTVKDATNTTQQASFTVVNGPDNVPPQASCPATSTQCYNLFSYYLVPQMTASDNCGVASITYAVTGATSRTGTGKNASGWFNAGTSTVTWTVKDLAGNTSTCSMQVIINKVNVTIPDVYAVTPGGSANTLYIGYGPSALTLTASAGGGTAPYTYLWSNGATTPSITVTGTSAHLYTYFVTVKDANGCINFGIKQVRVIDVRCSNNKVIVCHTVNGRSGEICVNKTAVPDYLAHGDKLGSCNNNDENNDNNNNNEDRSRTTAVTDKEVLDVTAASQKAAVAGTEMTGALGNGSVYPNPTSGKFSLRVAAGLSGEAKLLILNGNGIVVAQKQVQLLGKGQLVPLDLGGKAAGMYLVKLVAAGGTQTEKILLQ